MSFGSFLIRRMVDELSNSTPPLQCSQIPLLSIGKVDILEPLGQKLSI